MDFRLEFSPQPALHKIGIDDSILLMGSCFTEHIHANLILYKFSAFQNPSGNLFNPISIFKSLQSYIENRTVKEDELFLQQGLWSHWDFHSSLSSPSRTDAAKKMSEQVHAAHEFLRSSTHLIITLGSAFVYELEDDRLVANCHACPASMFKKRLLDPDEIVAACKGFMDRLREFNAAIHLTFTISPVRHLRDGFVENNRSKAMLIHAVTKLTSLYPEIAYFPAYELIMDDLRDYRFFAEDMVHPNYQATRYVWEKFATSSIDGRTRELMKELDQLNSAYQHKVLHPGSESHIKFKYKFYQQALLLSQRFPQLDFSSELSYFSN